MNRWIRSLMALTLAWCTTSHAQEVTQFVAMEPASLPRDVVIPMLATHHAPDQHYSLYLPPNYEPSANPQQRWPVLIILDPRGRAVDSLRLAVDGARKNGWVVLSSYQSRSDESEQYTVNSLSAILTEVQDHVAFDLKRLYFAGMSGTAKTLWTVLPQIKDAVAGMIGCGGGRPPELGKLKLAPPAFFGMAGDTDFNYQEMRDLEEDLSKVSTHHRLDIFDGPHGWPQQTNHMTRAIDWLELMAMRDGRTPVRAEFVSTQLQSVNANAGEQTDPLARLQVFQQAIADFDSLADVDSLRAEAAGLEASSAVRSAQKTRKRLASVETRFARDFDAWFTHFVARFAGGQRQSPPAVSQTFRDLRISSLQDDASDADQAVAQSAQRRLERVYVATSYYLPSAMAAQGDTERAERALEIAIAVFPDRPAAHWRLAAIESRAGKVNEAFRELNRSRALGYFDMDDLRENEDWSALRSDPRWQALMESSAQR